MSSNDPFSVAVPQAADAVSASTLVVGHAHLGMAGVTAADYLVRQLDSTQIGHVAPAELPAIAPFEDGVPRHHSRLYNVEEPNLVVLVSELFIPVPYARSFADALIEWTSAHPIEEIVLLHGVPFPHGPEMHEVFHVASPEYADRRLDGSGIEPLEGGFLDGVVGELVTRSLDGAAPDVGVFLTPTHPPGPDVEAAIKLLDAIESIYGFELDESELRELGEQLQQYYTQLADRLATLADREEPLGSHDYPEDRMYM